MSQIERFSYRNQENKTLGFYDISICEVGNHLNVIASEIPDNPGMTIREAFEGLFLQVCEFYKLDPKRVNWFEHCPKNSDSKEIWHEVLFELDENNHAINPVWKAISLIK